MIQLNFLNAVVEDDGHGLIVTDLKNLETPEKYYKEVILCQEKVQIKNDFFPSCQHT